jgi:hypothetical protein
MSINYATRLVFAVNENKHQRIIPSRKECVSKTPVLYIPVTYSVDILGKRTDRVIDFLHRETWKHADIHLGFERDSNP